MRYFLIVFSSKSMTGNIHFSYNGFPPKEWIEDSIKKTHGTNDDSIVITNILEFTEDDFESFRSKPK